MAIVKAETLLRKIQKNSKTLYSNKTDLEGKQPSRFQFNMNGNISIFKRREIVRPYLHPYDSSLVNEQIKKSIETKIGSTDKELAKNYDKFLPKHLINDLFSLYYNNSEKLNFEGLDKTNQVKFDILDSINNSLIKIVTNNSNIGSFVYTEAISEYLYKKFMTLPPEQQKQLQNKLDDCNQNTGKGDKGNSGGGNNNSTGNDKAPGNSQGNNSSKGNGKSDKNLSKSKPPEEDLDEQNRNDSSGDEESQRNADNEFRGSANNSFGNGSQTDYTQEAADKMEEDLKKMLNTKESKKELEKAMKQAEIKLDKLREIIGDDIIENDAELPEVEKREILNNINNIDTIRRSLSQLNTSKDKVLKAVEKILNNTTNYFSQRCITNDVELFEADQILDINGIELIHPAFRKSRLTDLSVTERKYIGKFDLYVDCSGSMSGGCGGDLSGVCRIDLAKSLAMQMKQLGILGELYEFEDKPKKIMNTDMSILMMTARGGTNIQTVVDNVIKNGNNAVVLTDGESHVDHYTHKALFIGIGTDFHYFKNYEGAGKKFVESGQCIAYTGKDFETVYLKK